MHCYKFLKNNNKIESGRTVTTITGRWLASDNVPH